MRRFLRPLVPSPLRSPLRRLYATLFDIYGTKSYSQEGEDLILARELGSKVRGFYVDVGACHPQRFSNTYFFYKRGWSGINIDAAPGSMAEFRRLRPRDINLEMAISREPSRTFYMFNEPALNSFDRELSYSRCAGPYRIIAEMEVAGRPLADVLSEYLPSHTAIDFLSVDVEGLDLEVLETNDWESHRPNYVLFECLQRDVEWLMGSREHEFLSQRGYALRAKTLNTAIYQSVQNVGGSS